MTRDLRTLIYLLNLELREECSRTLDPGMGWNSASGGCMQSGSSSRSGRAAVEADAIGEQQLKRTRSGEAAEADASSEQQLKRAQSGSSSWKRRQTGSSSGSGCRNRAREQQLMKRTQSGRSSSAQRAVRRRITHGRRTRGK